MHQAQDGCDNIHIYSSSTELVESFVMNINADNIIDYRYLCYQTREADYVNNRVRTQLYNSPEPYVAGELVMLGQSSSIGNTGDLVKITNVEKEYIEAGAFTGELCNLTLTCYKLNISGVEVYTFDRNMWSYIDNLHKSYADKIVELKKHNRFECVYNLTNEIIDINEMFVKLHYGYATTVHKSQGQSIENVYVNTKSLSKAPNKRALMYVALSRPISNIHVLVE